MQAFSEGLGNIHQTIENTEKVEKEEREPSFPIPSPTPFEYLTVSQLFWARTRLFLLTSAHNRCSQQSVSLALLRPLPQLFCLGTAGCSHSTTCA